MQVKNKIKGLIEINWQDDLLPLQPENAKIINNLENLKQSLKKHGFTLPFAVWKDGKNYYCVDGHTRVKTLKELQVEGVDVPEKLKAFEIEAKDRQEAIKVLVEVFNQKHNPFDSDVLTEWLDTEEVEVENLDFIDVKESINKDTGVDDGFNLEENVKTDIKLGDIIEIGNHRLLCGDSTKMEDYEKLMQEREFDLVVTDPPYNVSYKGKTKDALTIKNDSMDDDSFYNFLLSFYSSLFKFTKEGGGWYIWHADSEGHNFRKAMNESGVKVRQCLIWVKNAIVLGRQDYHWKHEPCLYGWKDGASHNWYSDRKQSTVLEFDKPLRNAEHPTMKPVSLISYLINNSSKKGSIIGDVFLGSGTTMVACEQMNRFCYGMELDPKYCQVIIDRMLSSFPNIEVKINGNIYEKQTSRIKKEVC